AFDEDAVLVERDEPRAGRDEPQCGRAELLEARFEPAPLATRPPVLQRGAEAERAEARDAHDPAVPERGEAQAGGGDDADEHPAGERHARHALGSEAALAIESGRQPFHRKLQHPGGYVSHQSRLLLAFALSGCTLHTTTPMEKLTYQVGTPPAKCLVVLMPGAGSTAGD